MRSFVIDLEVCERLFKKITSKITEVVCSKILRKSLKFSKTTVILKKKNIRYN